MKGREVFVTVAAEELDVAHGLRTFVFNGETAVRVLDVMGRCYDIVCDFEEILVVAAVRTFESIGYFGCAKRHNEAELRINSSVFPVKIPAV